MCVHDCLYVSISCVNGVCVFVCVGVCVQVCASVRVPVCVSVVRVLERSYPVIELPVHENFLVQVRN